MSAVSHERFHPCVCRAEMMRDKDGRLLPAPSTLINPMRITEKARKATGLAAFEARHDAIMEQVGRGHAGGHAKMVFAWDVISLPSPTTPSALENCCNCEPLLSCRAVCACSSDAIRLTTPMHACFPPMRSLGLTSPCTRAWCATRWSPQSPRPSCTAW